MTLKTTFNFTQAIQPILPSLGTAAGVLSLLLSASLALAAPAGSDSPVGDKETQERLRTLERAVEVLVREQERLRTAAAAPEQSEDSDPSGHSRGSGGAGSKFGGLGSGLSIGGYGEWRGRFFVNDDAGHDNVLDAVRAVLYVGNKFNERLLVNAELEFEHAGTGGGGSVSLEFLALDLLVDEAINFRAGLLLMPMGFINETHEPPFFFGVERPEVERRLLPSTWRENGVGVFGRLFGRVEYRVYAVNGLRASGFRSSGIRGGRQKGSRALANHFAAVGRVDVTLAPGFMVGASVYAGKSGQNEELASGSRAPDAPTLIWETHMELRRAGFHLRGLYTQVHVDGAGRLSTALGLSPQDAIAARMRGGYAEVAYDVLTLLVPDASWSAELFYRFEHVDTQDAMDPGFNRNPARVIDLHVAGFSIKPHPQVVFKADYRNIQPLGGGPVADEVQVGFGFVF